MSSKPGRKLEDEEEGTVIPVFTVIKNGVILKNIFVVNNPPSPVSGLSSIKFVQNSENSKQETEEILIVGRHPDCNIVLMHPSISRFHLQIDSNPSLQKLFVTDLSSVHGTWISEKKIDPGFRVELKEDDTIRMGASTRVYRLHWVPLSRTYDLENPFVSESDLALFEEKEEENLDKTSEDEDLLATENKSVEEKDSLAVLGKAEDTNQAIDSFDSEKAETQSLYSILEDVVSLFPDESSELIVKKEIPSPKSVEINSFHDEEEQTENSFRNDHELTLKSVGGVILQTLSAIFSDCNQSPEYLSAEEDVDFSMMTRLELESHPEVSSDSPSSITELDSASKITDETTRQSFSRKENEQKVDIHQGNKENQTPEYLPPASNPQSEEGNNQSPMRKEGILREATIYDPASIKVLEETEDQSPFRQECTLNESAIDDPATIEVFGEMENQSPSTKEGLVREPTIHEPASIGVLGETEDQGTIGKESILNEVFGETENQSPSVKEGILRELTIDDPTSIGVLGEEEDQSPSRKEGMPREPIIDGPAAIEVLEETEDKGSLMKEGVLIEEIIDHPAAFEVLGVTENWSPLRKEDILRDLTIDDPAAIVVLGKPEDQSPLSKEAVLREPIIDDPAAIEVLEEKEDHSPLRNETMLNEPAIDNPTPIEGFIETENQSPSMNEGILREPTIVSTVYLEAEESPKSSIAHGEVFPQSKQCQTPESNLREIENSENKMNSCDRSGKRIGSSNIWSRRGKPSSALQVQTSRSQRKTKRDEERDGAAEWENQENIECKAIRKDLFYDLEGMVEEIYTPDKENCNPNTSVLRSLKKNVEIKSTTRTLFSSLDAVDDENFTPNKENRTPNTSILRSKKKPVIELEDNTTRALFSNLDALDDENFTPNKENRTPNTSILRSKKKPIIELEDNMITSSDKENQTPQSLRELKSAKLSRHRFKLDKDIILKERRAERVPLQSLISNSPMSLSDASFPSPAKRSSSSISSNLKKINSAGDGRRRWTMIADTTSLLNKETRKALQLLQGLKGTQLIIPRIVIRELDSLKRRNSLFRRKTEASVVLEWIEECMVKTNWWIHVQNSVEEVRPIAPTPPATPVSQLREDFPFSGNRTPMGLVSPTPEDHILDCALLYRKLNNDGKLALLSNNVTLKIKAMAEGLICETAQEFRDSLVNPFSERFLWADSSPRGQTWSVFDDVVLKEKYYRSPSKKTSRGEAAKGLKLILLHNSHYVKTV